MEYQLAPGASSSCREGYLKSVIWTQCDLGQVRKIFQVLPEGGVGTGGSWAPRGRPSFSKLHEVDALIYVLYFPRVLTNCVPSFIRGDHCLDSCILVHIFSYLCAWRPWQHPLFPLGWAQEGLGRTKRSWVFWKSGMPHPNALGLENAICIRHGNPLHPYYAFQNESQASHSKGIFHKKYW